MLKEIETIFVYLSTKICNSFQTLELEVQATAKNVV